jgi:hypothetical protein
MRPVRCHALAQLASGFTYGNRRHDAIEPPIQIAQILLQGGAFQRVSLSSDCDGAQ